MGEEVDGLDDQALHLIATVDTKPIGTARILIKGSTAKIGRVCVLPTHRGSGAGAALIRAALGVSRGQAGVGKAMLGAQTHALPFTKGLASSHLGRCIWTQA